MVRAPALQAGGRGFESLCAHQKVVVQTDDLSGLSSRFDSSLPCGGELLYVWVEEDVERLAWSAVDLIVHLDVELVEVTRWFVWFAACAADPEVLRAARLSQLFTHVPDPRKARGKRHRLAVIVALAVAAVASGAKSIYVIADYATDTGIVLLAQPGHPASIVSEATFRRVIEALDPESFSGAAARG